MYQKKRRRKRLSNYSPTKVSSVYTAFTKFVEALSCPCQSLTVKCDTPPPVNCKGDTIGDACDCCLVCAKIKGEVCGGPFFTEGKCSRGLICEFQSYRKPIQSRGKCVDRYPRKINDPCGVAWQQGKCEDGLICHQITVANIGKCVNPKDVKNI
ncbi:unnamed protein product [Gordionus sp. m RMFG-2023]